MRTVAALYDSRAEAELARARLMSETLARSPRIIAKDTAGAVDGLKIAPRDAETYRQALRRGAHLLVAQVSGGSSARRVIEVLESAMGNVDETADQRDTEHGVQVEIADSSPPPEQRAPQASETPPQPPPEPAAKPEPAEPRQSVAADQPRQDVAADVPAEETPIPVASEELRIGKREVARGGARLRAFTRETPVEEQVSLREEIIDVESRPSERRLDESELEGLFKERVIEIAQMREEPVVTKEAFVREEVIVRKRVDERTETIRDTVRHTEVEVEDLAPSDEPGSAFFGRGSSERPAR